MSTQGPSSTSGTLHHVAPVSAFEVTPTTSTQSPNLLLWIGGLTDTYHSVDYVYRLASSLPPTWSLAQANLSSAGSGFGIASLTQDCNEISSLVSYFKNNGKQKVVIMGHSTGCQDCLHYFASEDKRGDRAKVDGVILQAPVSDREAMVKDMDKKDYDGACKMAEDWVKEGKGEHILPLNVTADMFGRNPLSARRWVALACQGGEDDYFSSDLPDSRLQSTFGKVDKPLLILYGEEDEWVALACQGGEDDYFSSDLPDSRLQSTFGKVDKPLLILYGEEDEYVPDHVDRKALVNKWIPFVKGKVDEQSKELLGGASHNLNGDDEEVADKLIKRVNKFLTAI
ncbi:MAG: Uncharacterized protein AUREO_013830 [Aureobasidium pullulans]|nr:MAG: Uncharacterized protein AUREO_013830 [Aureobasidium pullulans]